MHYAEARPLIRSGDVIAQTHRRWDTLADLQIQAVRVATQSEYSHVGIAWSIAGRLFVLEAVGAGVRIFPLSRAGDFFLLDRGIWSDEAEARAMRHVGAPYSKLDAVRSFFGLSDDTDDAWFCSEYVCVVLGIKLDKPTPAELVRYLLDREGLTLRSVNQ